MRIRKLPILLALLSFTATAIASWQILANQGNQPSLTKRARHSAGIVVSHLIDSGVLSSARHVRTDGGNASDNDGRISPTPVIQTMPLCKFGSGCRPRPPLAPKRAVWLVNRSLLI